MNGSVARLASEWQFFERDIDPLVRELLSQADPWEAYRRGLAVSDLMTDTEPGGSFSLPHAGGVYSAWGSLTDLYDTGKTPISDAHAALRRAAEEWLPLVPDAAFIEHWMSEAGPATGELFDRDGNWWRDPK